MSTTSGPCAHELAIAFSRFGPAFRKWITAGTTETTIPRLHLLRVLSAHGPQIMSALGEHLGVTPRNVTVLVDGLESEGLAQRVPHPQDRRATVVELTADGERMIDSAFADHIDRVSQLFERLTPREQSALLKIVTKLTDELTALGVTGCNPPAAAGGQAAVGPDAASNTNS